MRNLILSATFVAAAVILATLLQAAPTSVVPAVEPTKEEKEGLLRVHRNAVEVFVGRSGLGIERMEFPLDSIVTPKSLSEAPERKMPNTRIKHVALENFSGFAMRGSFPAEDKNEQWVTREVLLIGLVKNPEPVVYLKGQVPSEQKAQEKSTKEETPKKEEIKTRKLDQFESDSIKVIAGGGELQAERKGEKMRAVAAIYAGQACLKCHETEGQMLGAFTYRLERIALKPEGKGK